METLSTRSRGLKEILKNGVFEGFFSQRSKGSLDPGQLSKFRGEKTLEGRKKSKRGQEGGAGPRKEEEKKRKRENSLFYSLEPDLVEPDQTRLDQTKPKLDQTESE